MWGAGFRDGTRTRINVNIGTQSVSRALLSERDRGDVSGNQCTPRPGVRCPLKGLATFISLSRALGGTRLALPDCSILF